MLRTNSKKVIEAVKAYVVENYDGENYEAGTPEAEAKTFEEMARVILADVKRVEGYKVRNRWSLSWQTAFNNWACGLPSLLDTCYHYNVSAVDLLGGWLEETEEEKAKYTEQEAEKMIDYLIYRELSRVASDVLF